MKAAIEIKDLSIGVDQMVFFWGGTIARND